MIALHARYSESSIDGKEAASNGVVRMAKTLPAGVRVHYWWSS